MNSSSAIFITLKMKAICALLLVSLAIDSFADDRCTLYKTMTNYDFDYIEKAKLMCLFTELASTANQGDNYGHFAITRYWCLDPRRPGSNGCHVNCADLGDPTFRRDVRCAYKILIIQGIPAWGNYGKTGKCSESDLTKYIPQCV